MVYGVAGPFGLGALAAALFALPPSTALPSAVFAGAGGSEGAEAVGGVGAGLAATGGGGGAGDVWLDGVAGGILIATGFASGLGGAPAPSSGSGSVFLNVNLSGDSGGRSAPVSAPVP